MKTINSRKALSFTIFVLLISTTVLSSCQKDGVISHGSGSGNSVSFTSNPSASPGKVYDQDSTMITWGAANWTSFSLTSTSGESVTGLNKQSYTTGALTGAPGGSIVTFTIFANGTGGPISRSASVVVYSPRMKALCKDGARWMTIFDQSISSNGLITNAPPDTNLYTYYPDGSGKVLGADGSIHTGTWSFLNNDNVFHASLNNDYMIDSLSSAFFKMHQTGHDLVDPSITWVRTIISTAPH